MVLGQEGSDLVDRSRPAGDQSGPDAMTRLQVELLLALLLDKAQVRSPPRAGWCRPATRRLDGSLIVQIRAAVAAEEGRVELRPRSPHWIARPRRGSQKGEKVAGDGDLRRPIGYRPIRGETRRAARWFATSISSCVRTSPSRLAILTITARTATRTLRWASLARAGLRR